jgi:hypothetical protein
LNFSAKEKKKKKKEEEKNEKESSSLLCFCFLQKLTRTLSPSLLLSCSASTEKVLSKLSFLLSGYSVSWREKKRKVRSLSSLYLTLGSAVKGKKKKKEKDPLSFVSFGLTYLCVFGVFLNISS